MFNRLVNLTLKVIVALVVLVGILFLLERVRGKASLNAFKRHLVAKGEKLKFEELVPAQVDRESGAQEFVEAVKQLQDGDVLPRNYPPVMKLCPTGRAIVCFREPEWFDCGWVSEGKFVEGRLTNHWTDLERDIAKNEPYLAQIRAALGKPVLVNKIDHAQLKTAYSPHLSCAKSAALWLQAKVMLALHQNRLTEAAHDLEALVNIPRLFAEDRLLISELVRIAVLAVARAVTWEALQADGWTDVELVQLQRAWEKAEFVGAMTRVLEGERAFGIASLDELRRSYKATLDLLSWQDLTPFFSGTDTVPRRRWWRGKLLRPVYCWVWRFAWLDQNELRYLQQMQQLLEATRTAQVEKTPTAIRTAVAQAQDQLRKKSFMDQVRYADPEPVATITIALERVLQAETERSLVLCAIALKRYAVRYGHLPETLDALVPEFLTAIPTDYMNNTKIKYRLNPDGSYTLYSVGVDGVDNGGDTTRTPGVKAGGTIWARRDCVWPAPALPEEIESYRLGRPKDNQTAAP